jgi:hypothetical protein
MLVVMYYDWFGTPEAMEKWNTAWKKACDETKGMKSVKLYTSHQARYHYAWIMEMDSYDNIMQAMTKMPERDRNALTHAVMEVFTEM